MDAIRDSLGQQARAESLAGELPSLSRVYGATVELLNALDACSPTSAELIWESFTELSKREALRPNNDRPTLRGHRVLRRLLVDLRKATFFAESSAGAESGAYDSNGAGRPRDSQGKRLALHVACICAPFGIAPSTASNRLVSILEIVWRTLGRTNSPLHALRSVRTALEKSGYWYYEAGDKQVAYVLQRDSAGRFKGERGHPLQVLKEIRPGGANFLPPANPAQVAE